MARYEHSGSAQDAHLVGTLSATGLGLSIDSYGGWPTGAVNKFWIAIDPDSASEEHILVNTRSAGSLTIAAIGDRGKEGTTAVQHSAGAVVRHVFAATEADDMALLSDNNVFTGVNRFTGVDHYFGANANGGSGTRVHLGSLADPNNAYVTAEGSGTDVGLLLKSKGGLSVKTMDGAGNTQGEFKPRSAVGSLQTALSLYYNIAGAAKYGDVTLGAADSGGTGFRVLVVPNS